MCQTYPGFRCTAKIAHAKHVAEENYGANPTEETKNSFLLASHDYCLTSAGIKALYNSGDLLGALRAMDEREERLATSQRFKAWAGTVSKEEAAACRERLHRYSPWHLISVEEHWKGEVRLRPRGGSRNVDIAYNLAVKAHAGVARKNGSPYVNHPLRVYNRLTNNCRHRVAEETLIVALLHDAVEDSDLTFNDLRLLGFSERVIRGVDSVTKRSGESYPDAVARAALNPDGRWVKIADNLDNSSPEELLVFDEVKRLKQQRKYYPAIRFLRSVIHQTLQEAA